jgi:ribonuclease R
VTRFGLFIKLDETGADGLVPIGNLGTEFFHHEEATHALIGERSGLTYRLGEQVTVRLEEAVPVTGGLRFEMVEGGREGKPAGRRGSGRSGAGRHPKNKGPKKSLRHSSSKPKATGTVPRKTGKKGKAKPGRSPKS